jgi:predicted lipoprotein with Yx(FWY)xxD motif
MSKHIIFSSTKIFILLMCAGFVSNGAVASDAVPAAVVMEEQGHGSLIKDADGMSLYFTELDQVSGKSACIDACAEQWPPLTAGDEAVASGDWQPITRDDGSRQWAFRGQPLYLFSSDKAPGDDFGDGFRNAWHIAIRLIDTPSTVEIRRTMLGHILVDAANETALYFSDADEPGKSVCDLTCTQTWLPLTAPLMATGRDAWSINTREDGTRQWSFDNVPLYRFSGDWNTGDTHGDQVDASWHVAVLEPPQPIPEWVTVQGSDAGNVLADERGLTIYGRDQARVYNPPADIHALRQKATGDCGVECPGSFWRPVIAAEDSRAVASWSLVDRKDGKRQWVFKGEPLYIHARDGIPGDLHGIRSGDRSWHALMASGKGMQGTGN